MYMDQLDAVFQLDSSGSDPASLRPYQLGVHHCRVHRLPVIGSIYY